MGPRRSSTRTRRPLRDGGFTFVEMVAIMVLVSILAAAAVAQLDRLEDSQAGIASRQLLRDLAYARQRAVATGSVTWVSIDPVAETWTILHEDPLNPGRVNAAVLTDLSSGEPMVETLGTGAFVAVQLATVDFDGNDEVGFDWLGRPRGASEAALAAEGVVTLTGGHTIRVAAGTGYATHEGP